jgi:hypothetical protein
MNDFFVQMIRFPNKSCIFANETIMVLRNVEAAKVERMVDFPFGR